jgi:Ca2+-binding EF-hand superfamily protein
MCLEGWYMSSPDNIKCQVNDQVLWDEVFLGLDMNRDGHLSLNECVNLREIFESTGLPFELDHLDKFYVELDEDKDGLISHDEFRNAILMKEMASMKFMTEYILAWKGLDSQGKLDLMFRYLDKDNDGILTTKEVQEAFEAHQDLYKERPGSIDFQTIFEGVDQDNDGIVTRSELWEKFSVLDDHALRSFHINYLVTSGLKLSDTDLDTDDNSIIKIFYTVDTDGNGFITFEEFRTFCLDINKFDFVDKDLSMASVMTGFEAFDTNNDERITWSEFLYGFQQNQKLAVVDAFLTISHDSRRDLSFREKLA